MSELIYKQQAIDAIYNTFSYAYCNNCENNGKDDDSCDECHRKYQNWAASRKVIENTLNCLPSAEQERSKGEWIPHKSIFGGLDENVYTCNQCGYNIGFHTENFCPRCGADMRGERDE